MSRLVEKLLANLDGQIDLYRRGLGVLQKKQRSLVANDISALEESVAEEQEFVLAAEQIEQARQAIVKLLAEEYQSKDYDFFAKDAAPALSGESGLDSRKDELLSLAEEVRHVNRINSMLTRSSLEFVSSVMQTVFPNSTSASAYSASGLTPRSRLGSALLHTEA